MKLTKKTILIFLILILLLAVTTGGLLARYLTERQSNTSMHSGNFYISSDLLEKAGASHNVTDWNTNGITFQVYNYAKQNPSLITETDITYTVSAPSGWSIGVKDEYGTTVLPSTDGYTIAGALPTHHTITLIAPASADAEDVITVGITTISPYATTLSADFTLKGKASPEYKIEDCDTYVLVTLYTNNYSGVITFNWTADFSPDNTNPIMSDWLDTAKTANVDLPSNTTYELIFFKNSSIVLNRTLTADMTVTVG